MLARMKTHLIEFSDSNILRMRHKGALYQFPNKIAEKYRMRETSISAEEFFSKMDKKYTKAGALLQGVRARENITQIEMAKKLKVTQSDISQMENGKRKIGLKMAKRIAKLFDVHYESFLSTSI